MELEQSNDRQIIRWPELHRQIKKSRAQVWRDVRAGLFPAPIELGPNSVGWYQDEITEHLRTRPRRTYRAVLSLIILAVVLLAPAVA